MWENFQPHTKNMNDAPNTNINTTPVSVLDVYIASIIVYHAILYTVTHRNVVIRPTFANGVAGFSNTIVFTLAPVAGGPEITVKFKEWGTMDVVKLVTAPEVDDAYITRSLAAAHAGVR